MGRYTQTPIFKSNDEYKTAPNKRYYGTTKYPEVPFPVTSTGLTRT